MSAARERLRRSPRLRRIMHGGLSALAGKGTSLLAGALTLPLMVRYLGPVEYGIWVTISSTVILLAVLDLGLSNTLTNFIAKANTADDQEMARRYFATAFYVTLLLSAGLAGVSFLVWLRMDWGTVFGLRDPVLVRQAALCAGVAVGFFFVNLPLTLAGRALSGFQQVQIANYFAMVGSVLGLAAIVIGVLLHFTLVELMVSFCASISTGQILLNGWLLFRSRPWLRPRLSLLRVELVRELFGEGLRFFVLQLAGLVVFNTDNLVILHFLGAREVTPYSVAARLMSYAAMLPGLLVPVLWPAFADAYQRGDLGWVRSTYRRVARVTVVGVCGVAGTLALVGQGLIRAWATEVAVPPKSLLWAMAVWAVILTISTNQACLLAATGRIGLQAVMAAVAAVFNLAASIYLVRTMGSIGVIVATIASYVLFLLAPQSWEVRHVLRGRYVAEG